MSVPTVIPVNTWVQIKAPAFVATRIQAGGPSGVRFFLSATNPGSSDASSGIVLSSGATEKLETANAALGLWARSLFTDDVASVLTLD